MARARLALELSRYRPIASVPRVKAGILFLSAGKDTLCPPELVRTAAALVPNSGAVLEMPELTHFDLYRWAAAAHSLARTAGQPHAHKAQAGFCHALAPATLLPTCVFCLYSRWQDMHVCSPPLLAACMHLWWK